MKLFKCQACAQLIYFENTLCEKCSHQLGYIPEINTLSALEARDRDWSSPAASGTVYRYCANADFDVCNWLVDAASPDIYCLSCRHNRTIPDINSNDNLLGWRKIESAKHRLFYSLLRLNLPLGNQGQVA